MTDAQQAKSDREALLARLEQAEARVKELEAELSLIYASEGAAPGPSGPSFTGTIAAGTPEPLSPGFERVYAEIHGEPLRIVKHMRNIADASRRADGSDTPLGEQCREAASTIERLQRELRLLREQQKEDFDRALAAEASLAKAREALKPLAAEQLSTEYEVRDLVKVFPAEELRRRAQAVEARDRAILAARSILGDQPT